MNQIREFHRVLNEKNRNIVADQIPIALVGIELHRETAHVAHCIGRAPFANDGREAHEHRRALAGLGEERRSRIFFERFVAFEIAMCGRTAGMDYALRYTLVIEMGDLLAQNKILEQRRPAKSGFERILVIGDWDALIRGQRLVAGIDTYPIQWRDCVGLLPNCGLPAPALSEGLVSVNVLPVADGFEGVTV